MSRDHHVIRHSLNLQRKEPVSVPGSILLSMAAVKPQNAKLDCVGFLG